MINKRVLIPSISVIILLGLGVAGTIAYFLLIKNEITYCKTNACYNYGIFQLY